MSTPTLVRVAHLDSELDRARRCLDGTTGRARTALMAVVDELLDELLDERLRATRYDVYARTEER